MKSLFAALSIAILIFSTPLLGQELPAEKIQPCLVVSRYGTDGPFFYRDQYGVSVERLRLWFSPEELTSVVKSGIKVVVYDTKEHESFSEARQSCFLSTLGDSLNRKNQ